MAAPGRVELMNASPTHSKVRLKLHLSSPLFVAGEDITGKLELESKADKGLAIGRIRVELVGSQELTSRDHSALSTFLHTTRDFQGPGLPPSNAVHPFPHHANPHTPEDPLPRNYYPARKGTTTFFYSLPLPITSPSSCEFKGIAKIRYAIRASCEVIWRGDSKIVTGLEEANVVEVLSDDVPNEMKGVGMGEGGKIWAQGTFIGACGVAGEQGCVVLTVKNQTAKPTTGLSLSFIRSLHLSLQPHDSSANPEQPHISETLVTIPFKGVQYTVLPGTEGTANLLFTIPKTGRGVKGGDRMNTEGGLTRALFELRCILEIKILLGGFASKDVSVAIPVAILHPNAVPGPLPDPYILNPPNPPFHPHHPHHHIHPPSPHSHTPFEPHSPLYNVQTGASAGEHGGWTSPAPHPTNGHGYFPRVSPPDHRQYHHLPHQHYQTPSPHYAYGYDHYQQQPYAPHFVYGQSNTPPAQINGHIYYSPPRHDHQHVAFYAQPPRPSSTEPPQARQPLVVNNPSPPAENETGEVPPTPEDPNKGPVSRRVSNHLRRSSVGTRRGRSMSPPASRSQILPDPPVANVPREASVLSPRPLLSPRQSYSTVVGHGGGGSARSEGVEELERIVALAQEKGADKTLPKTPQGSALLAVPAGDEEEELDVRELIAREGIQPLTAPGGASGTGLITVKRRVGGLDALEKRLVMDVGTKRITEVPPNNAPLANILDRGTFKPSPEGPAPVDAGPLERRLLRDVGTRKIGLGTQLSSNNRALKLDVLSSDTLLPPDLGRNDTGTPTSPTHKRSMDFDDLPPTPSPAPRKGGIRRKSSAENPKEGEMKMLRKDAKNRVADWLVRTIDDGDVSPRGEDVDDPMKGTVTAPLKIMKTTPPKEIQKTASVRTKETAPVMTSKEEPTGQLAVPNSPHQKSPPVQAMKPRFDLDKLSTPSPNAKYDVRSARGGKGGVVTSVAAIWASKETNVTSSPTPATPGKGRVTTITPPKASLPPPISTATQTAPLPKLKPPALLSPKPKSPTANQYPPTPTSPTADGGKAASVPALLSSKMATPVLSSTASLARPSPARNLPRTAMMPTIDENLPSSKPLPPKITPKDRDLPVGRAKLQDLIKKYEKA